MKLNLTNCHTFALRIVSRSPRLFQTAQRIRYVVMRGPLQKVFVSYYRKHSKTERSLARAPDESLFEPIEIEKAIEEINTKSHSACLQLPDETVHQILDFWKAEKSNNIFHPHKKCPAIYNIAGDSQIIAVVRGYLRAEPIFYGSRLFYTPPRIDASGQLHPKYVNAKMAHCDVTDFLDVCVFFYLHEVDLDTSPHIVFAGTHTNKTLKDLIVGRYTETEARKRFGDNLTTLTGRAGSGFFEDTSAFHIQSCGKKGRLALSLAYTLQRRAEMARHQEIF